jgi:hypothetical protein
VLPEGHGLPLQAPDEFLRDLDHARLAPGSPSGTVPRRPIGFKGFAAARPMEPIPLGILRFMSVT